MVTHDDNFALEADRVIRIRDGRIQAPDHPAVSDPVQAAVVPA
jgi:ABC-type lipoprotein export system ATPase subunit